MGLSSIFKRRTAGAVEAGRLHDAPGSARPSRRGGRSRAPDPVGPGAGGEPIDEVQQARTRARRRLIGAVVLLGIGIVGFPLVFETQPRPIPVDIPIEIPHKDGAPPLTLGPARAPDAAVGVDRAQPAVPTPPDDVVTESKEEAGRDTPARVADAAPPRVPTPRPPTAPQKPEPRPAAEPKRGDNDAARAQALLDGKPAAPAASSAARFVVQVGAFADANAAHDTRLKVEKLGLKSYTQVASTAAGGRIRVRVGPFASRDDADKALAKARGAGLAAVVITL